MVPWVEETTLARVTPPNWQSPPRLFGTPPRGDWQFGKVTVMGASEMIDLLPKMMLLNLKKLIPPPPLWHGLTSHVITQEFREVLQSDWTGSPPNHNRHQTQPLCLSDTTLITPPCLKALLGLYIFPISVFWDISEPLLALQNISSISMPFLSQIPTSSLHIPALCIYHCPLTLHSPATASLSHSPVQQEKIDRPGFLHIPVSALKQVYSIWRRRAGCWEGSSGSGIWSSSLGRCLTLCMPCLHHQVIRSHKHHRSIFSNPNHPSATSSLLDARGQSCVWQTASSECYPYCPTQTHFVGQVQVRMWHNLICPLCVKIWSLCPSLSCLSATPIHGPICVYILIYRYGESEDYHFYQGLVYLLENDVSTLGYDLTFSTEVGQDPDCFIPQLV